MDCGAKRPNKSKQLVDTGRCCERVARGPGQNIKLVGLRVWSGGWTAGLEVEAVRHSELRQTDRQTGWTSHQ